MQSAPPDKRILDAATDLAHKISKRRNISLNLG
jgi:hypothetical protein